VLLGRGENYSTMPYQFLVIPFSEEKEVFEDQAFRKLEKKGRIRNCQATFFQSQTGKSYWTVFVEYEIERKRENENLS
jgi:hypothetical protein